MQFDRSTPWGRIVLAWRRRGAIGSIGRVFRIIQDRLFDLRYGIDTCNHARLGSLTIESVNARAGFEYEPTRLCTFRKVMSTLHPPPGSVLVDFGCGKGRV